MIRSYSEMISMQSFEERFNYLKLKGSVGHDTFGFDRYLNQKFYKSREWKDLRNHIILRDNGCDLGIEGYDIFGKILIHHINPLTPDDIRHSSDGLLDPDNLICVSHDTHNAIHFGDETLLRKDPVVRSPGDTRLW